MAQENMAGEYGTGEYGTGGYGTGAHCSNRISVCMVVSNRDSLFAENQIELKKIQEQSWNGPGPCAPLIKSKLELFYVHNVRSQGLKSLEQFRGKGKHQ